MDEYVAKDAVLDAIAEDHGKRNDAEERVAVEIWDRIKAIPAADVVEVRHGEWLDEFGGKYDNAMYVCSVCRAKAFYTKVIDELHSWQTIQARTPFCPICGAKMDGKGDGE